MPTGVHTKEESDDANPPRRQAWSWRWQFHSLSKPKALGEQHGGIDIAAVWVHAGEYASYIGDYAATYRIRPLRRDVTALGRQGSTFRVTFRDCSITAEYQAVVVCTGMFDNPYTPELSGLAHTDSSHGTRIPHFHASLWRGPDSNMGRRVLIVGGGTSAVEIAEECVRAGLSPALCTRTNTIRLWPEKVFGLEPRNLVYRVMRWLPLWTARQQCSYGWRHRGTDRGFRKFLEQKTIKLHPMVHDVRSQRVTFVGGSSLETDSIVFATGYRFTMPFLPESLPRLPLGVPYTRRSESVRWPGLFFIGVPCALRSDSHFVHGIAADARVVATAVERYMSQGRSRRPTNKTVTLRRPSQRTGGRVRNNCRGRVDRPDD